MNFSHLFFNRINKKAILETQAELRSKIQELEKMITDLTADRQRLGREIDRLGSELLVEKNRYNAIKDSVLTDIEKEQKGVIEDLLKYIDQYFKEISENNITASRNNL